MQDGEGAEWEWGGGGARWAGLREQGMERNFQGKFLFQTQEFVLSDITKTNLWITALATRTAGGEEKPKNSWKHFELYNDNSLQRRICETSTCESDPGWRNSWQLTFVHQAKSAAVGKTETLHEQKKKPNFLHISRGHPVVAEVIVFLVFSEKKAFSAQSEY